MGRPIRILHVLGALNRGGVETWLLHLLRGIDRERFHMDFLVHAMAPGVYDVEVRALGSAVLICPYPAPPWSYARRMRRLLQEHGPYDVVHSHVHHFSGFVLRLAQNAGVPSRIAHSHTTESPRGGLMRRSYVALMRHWLSRHATVCLSASRLAHEALFGSLNGKLAQRRLLPCGIDLTPFAEKVAPAVIRAELGLPSDAFVLGHVGRLAACKNHALLVALIAAMPREAPPPYLLLVGEGEMRSAIKDEAARRGVSERIVFAGGRADVARLLRGAMDVFVFPSHYEGLGLAAVEAQAAGLPCLLSDGVPEEATVVAPLVRRMSLSQPPAAWAEAVLALRANRPAIDRDQAREIVENSLFNLCAGVEQLQQLYATARTGEEASR